MDTEVRPVTSRTARDESCASDSQVSFTIMDVMDGCQYESGSHTVDLVAASMFLRHLEEHESRLVYLIDGSKLEQ